MKKKRTYSARLIKADYSYSVEQVADLFGIDVATVLRWIRLEGLRRIPKARPYMIHSSDLREFLGKKQTDRKKPCAYHEVFCFKCQLPRTPRTGTATCDPLPNSSVRFKAACSECGGKMCRSIRGAEWTQNHPLAKYLSGATGEHNRAYPPHRECPLQKETE